MPSTTFAQLGVPESIRRVLDARGITQPFEIQAVTIADALAGRDVCGRAPTGSGKTLAFGVPLVATVGVAKSKRPRALVLVPTRELADQIAAELRALAHDVRIGVVYGGVGYGAQIKQLRQGVDILIACPGRLGDLIERDAVRLYQVDQVVIDEADRMADMGFLPVVRRLLDLTATPRQTMLFSATLDGEVARLTRDYQNDPVRHEVGDATPDVTSADHRFWSVERNDRVDASARVVASAWPAVVFCRTRHGSDRVARQLSQRGVSAVAIHGGHPQKRRTKALARFSSGEVQALVATDVAARGIHVDGVASVIHFDLPEDHKAYIHRSGRTARAGEDGLVVSLVQPDQVKATRSLQRELGMEHPITTPDGDTIAVASKARSQTRSRPKSKPKGRKPVVAGEQRGKPRHRKRSPQAAGTAPVGQPKKARHRKRSRSGKRGGPARRGGGQQAGPMA